MSRAGTIRDAWHPQTRQECDAVLEELHQVLSSPQFSNSKRYPALLQYIVEKSLAGKADLLKERTIGVEVFDRPPTYDTNADTVVRYTAGEVRKRLQLYYHELERKPLVQIALPAGSYVPEFHLHEEASSAKDEGSLDHPGESKPPELVVVSHAVPPVAFVEMDEGLAPALPTKATKRLRWIAIAALGLLLAITGAGWKLHTAHAAVPLNDFWAPVLHGQHNILLCTGGSVFSKNTFSGVTTAGRDIDYPFVSMQSASAIAHLAGLAELNGVTTQLEAAASTPVTELRERPIILLGGYNNQWTLRLLQPLPIHFSPEVDASIIDTTQAQTHWARDHSLPYSSADDYALVARFRDTTTDSWVLVLAGLGRNGTEAAAQFVTSAHYMDLLRDRLGSDFGSRNIEAVIKLSVIDGKTGAPTLLAVHAW